MFGDKRPICETRREIGDKVVNCQRYAVITVDGTHYCNRCAPGEYRLHEVQL